MNREKIRAFARNSGIRRPLDGPVRVGMVFFTPHDPLDTRTGDLDNYEKAVKDALQGIAFKNDRQVVELHAVKVIDREHPRAEVEIETVEAT